jgi:hypothetical protein
MEPGSITVGRSLAIDAALLADVLLRLRRDAPGAVIRWTLAERGAVEIDVNFTSDGAAFTTTARIWERQGLAVANMTVRVAPRGADAVDLTAQPSAALPAWWASRVPEFLDVADAAVAELGEELLWHASYAGLAGLP